ncbi:MAG: phage capsid protein [Akkermansia sp.]
MVHIRFAGWDRPRNPRTGTRLRPSAAGPLRPHRTRQSKMPLPHLNIISFTIMAVTITDNYQVKYTKKWGTLLQQHASRLDKYVSVMRDLSGKVVFLDQFGVLDFTEKTTRVGQTVLNEAPTTRRSMRPRTFTKAIGYDEFDATRLGDMDLPVSKTIVGLQAAAGRRMDDVMISGFLDTNYVGEDGMTAVPFKESQQIAVDRGQRHQIRQQPYRGQAAQPSSFLRKTKPGTRMPRSSETSSSLR